MNDYYSIEEAIDNGSPFYWDEYHLSQGRSGGSVCPKCRKFTQLPRKRKNPQMTWLNECDLCEIKDPFRKMWHQFNKTCNQEQRKLHNEWLDKVRLLTGDLEFFPNNKTSLYNLLQKIPFFDG